MPESQSAKINTEKLSELLESPLLSKAYEFAKSALADKKRQSGDLYLDHIIATACKLAEWKQSEAVIAAGFLHSTIGSGTATVADLKREFGVEIASLVTRTRQITNTKYSGMERHAEELRRFLVSIAKDARILLLAFAHRLDTLGHLGGRTKEQQLSIARETLEIYAPLANRLGMGSLKAQFETTCFPYVYPAEYKEVKKLIKKREQRAAKNLEKVYRSLRRRLAKEEIPVLGFDYRLKNIYSLWKKLKRYGMEIDKITDLLALRIITNNQENCYKILGIINSHWKPVPDKVKDYIKTPKVNGYRSLHTTVYTGDRMGSSDGGRSVEIQIRTEEMHDEAEYGVVARLAYEESNKPDSGGVWAKHLFWVKELLSIAKKHKDLGNFTEAASLDFFKNRIFVLTPTGDVIELPEDSTPIDFAYAIHSDLGSHASGATVDGKRVPLDTKLQSGQVVSIEKSKNSHPTRKWLKFARSTSARHKISNTLVKLRL